MKEEGAGGLVVSVKLLSLAMAKQVVEGSVCHGDNDSDKFRKQETMMHMHTTNKGPITKSNNLAHNDDINSGKQWQTVISNDGGTTRTTRFYVHDMVK
ncbi:unnamed protein product [Sphenostylis stenocarpa]|uniref:Uncharacterized protein n=1 Tax=Sphenostylis stenocarpa TaxID=92480 RepID=A0AA86RYS9_9FABA|nr:unnamed protein product [Sphenostylis stenocarpa]